MLARSWTPDYGWQPEGRKLETERGWALGVVDMLVLVLPGSRNWKGG